MAKRRINFFRVDMTRLEHASNTIIPVESQGPFASRIVSHINSLDFTAANPIDSRYMNISGGNEVSMYIDNVNAEYIEGRMAVCRRRYLPDVEQGGVLSPLDIPSTAGLAECTHFVYYFNSKIIGIEFNFYGPRSSHIGDYMAIKCNNIIAQFLITPVIKGELDRALLSNEIAMFQIEAHRNAGNVVQELHEDLGLAFNAAATAACSETIEIILRKRPHVRKGFLPFLNLDNLRAILGKSDNREMFNKLRVAVLDENNGCKLRPVDLLADKLSVSKDVNFMDERSRRIHSPSMYAAIQEAYCENRDQLVIE